MDTEPALPGPSDTQWRTAGVPEPQPPHPAPLPHQGQRHWNRPPSGHRDPGVGRWPAEGRGALNEDSDFLKNNLERKVFGCVSESPGGLPRPQSSLEGQTRQRKESHPTVTSAVCREDCISQIPRSENTPSFYNMEITIFKTTWKTRTFKR